MRKFAKIFRTVFITILALFLALIALVLFNIYAAENWSPFVQPNTKWVSEDGRITFVTKDDGETEGTTTVNGRVLHVKQSGIYTVGTITINGNSTDVKISQIGYGSTIWVMSSDTTTIDIGTYESWKGYYISKKKCVIKVEYGCFLEEGETITLYRKDWKTGDGSAIDQEEKAKEITFNLYDYNWELENCSYEKNVGVVTTREEAIGKAKELWKERYGNIIKINDSPVAVAYDSQNECWRVNGTFPDDDNINVDGAVPCAIIRKNGEVLALWIG